MSADREALRCDVDFQNVDFQNVDFQNVDFQNVDFQKVNFQNVDFQNVDFQNVDFQNVDFQNVNKLCVMIHFYSILLFHWPRLTAQRRCWVAKKYVVKVGYLG
jgi:hypothetical protein